MHILIMAGGTGGHIFPALAVAKKLLEQGHVVHWLGTSKGMEVEIATNNNIEIHRISIAGIRGKSLAMNERAIDMIKNGPAWIGERRSKEIRLKIKFHKKA